MPLPFVCESTGVVTRFTDTRDPKPRSREVFNFPRPETMQDWHAQLATLRARLQGLPHLDPTGLRVCQVNAIEGLEASFKDDHPRALIQMATGSGKTYAAITSIYRLLKHADAKRVLFLVDTKNLGEQAEQEFMAYVPSDDNRKFTELYNVQRLTSSFVAQDSQVCISTIQRMYSLLKGAELDDATEEINPAEMMQPKTPMPVVYNGKIPPEFFDFIIIDECHRSIYNLWRQVLEYFDASLIGLTATPDNRTYGFFRKNVVSEYAHEQAVADGVNVGNEIYAIDTEKTRHGGQLKVGQQIEKRERLTRGSGGKSRTMMSPMSRSNSTVTSSTLIRFARSSAPSATSCRRYSPAAPRCRRRLCSPRPTVTPMTSSRPCARNSLRVTSSARRSPTRPMRIQNPSSLSSGTTTIRASP